MLPIVGDLIEAGLRIIDKVIPDPQAKADAKLKLLELQQKGELEGLAAEVALAKGQMEINLAEAQSSSLFKGGWRPAIGWIGALGLAYQFIVQPLLSWYSGTKGFSAPPVLDLGDLLTILGGMLGLGTLRTIERINGTVPKGN